MNVPRAGDLLTSGLAEHFSQLRASTMVASWDEGSDDDSQADDGAVDTRRVSTSHGEAATATAAAAGVSTTMTADAVAAGRSPASRTPSDRENRRSGVGSAALTTGAQSVASSRSQASEGTQARSTGTQVSALHGWTGLRFRRGNGSTQVQLSTPLPSQFQVTVTISEAIAETGLFGGDATQAPPPMQRHASESIVSAVQERIQTAMQAASSASAASDASAAAMELDVMHFQASAQLQTDALGMLQTAEACVRLHASDRAYWLELTERGMSLRYDPRVVDLGVQTPMVSSVWSPAQQDDDTSGRAKGRNALGLILCGVAGRILESIFITLEELNAAVDATGLLQPEFLWAVAVLHAVGVVGVQVSLPMHEPCPDGVFGTVQATSHHTQPPVALDSLGASPAAALAVYLHLCMMRDSGHTIRLHARPDLGCQLHTQLSAAVDLASGV